MDQPEYQNRTKSSGSGLSGPCDDDRDRAQHDSAAAGLERRIFAAALSLLGARSQSEEQLRRRLIAKFGPVSEIDQCLARLKDKGHINDSRMAENYAAHRTGFKAMGKARLGRELSGKLISKDVIDSALTRVFESVSEEELIDKAIQKRLRSTGIPASKADRKKLFDHLARLGFEYNLIMKRIRSLGPAADVEIPED